MKTVLFVFLVLCLLVACGPSQASPQVPTTANPTAVKDTQPVPTAQPTPTSPPVQATAATYAFRDDFEAKLGTGWSWIGEIPANWSLADAPGNLRVLLTNSNFNDGEPKNFLVRDAPEGNFEISTYIKFQPFSSFQFAGLLVYQSQGNALQFGRSYAKCPIQAVCKGNGIYFDIVEGGAGGKPNHSTTVSNEKEAYLRLTRENTTYSGYYSENGKDWVLIGKHESNIKPVKIGLIASQAYEEATIADFDYFEVKTLP